MTQKICLLFLLLISSTLPCQAIWFEASGQSMVVNGNKQLARQQATQEAIKQALLFAGASVHSIQKMTNGLLQSDKLEIRASGEVDSIELINEQINGDFVTVSIRADIFPNKVQCRAADYQKSIATSWFPLRNRQQALTGNLFDFGKAVAQKLQSDFQQYAAHSNIMHLAQFYSTTHSVSDDMVIQFADQTDSQYVMFNTITELSVDPQQSSGIKFWQDNFPQRHFGLHVSVFNGTTGEQVYNQQFNTSAVWDFPVHEQLDPASQRLWSSKFGLQVQNLLQDISSQVDEALSCLPVYGRILRVKDEQISINLGSRDGVKQGDELSLFQLEQFYDRSGNQHYQYHIHPAKLQITQVFNDTALLKPTSDELLANIQPNDFVLRR
ncbi:flagellar assembly protein T N-terminal domain-containing protein [Neptunicella sp. SCSIO 80796]|uniref:flagellar assembly protein T N-terminal domain-containing protein n=1 Tax=Neptunicella plasticusilytica TaxID=3117012 RepID=UPI003A4E1C4A